MIQKELEKLKFFLEQDTLKAKLIKVMLVSIAISTVPIIAFGAASLGNSVQIIKIFKKRKSYSYKQLANAAGRLSRFGMIEFVSAKNGVTTVRITKKGISYIRKLSLESLSIKKPKKWDGKWRMVMFDLPVRYTKVRDALRFQLKKLGFIQFQKSVWIHPYPCIDEILFTADYYKVGKYVEVLTVEKILNDKKLRKSFGLY